MIHEQQRMEKIVSGNDDELERLLEHDEQQKEHVNKILAKSSQLIGSSDPKEDTSKLEKLIQNMKASLEAQLILCSIQFKTKIRIKRR
jgi:acetate kinase